MGASITLPLVPIGRMFILTRLFVKRRIDYFRIQIREGGPEGSSNSITKRSFYGIVQCESNGLRLRKRSFEVSFSPDGEALKLQSYPMNLGLV